jgi:hypothetical protein
MGPMTADAKVAAGLACVAGLALAALLAGLRARRADAALERNRDLARLREENAELHETVLRLNEQLETRRK